MTARRYDVTLSISASYPSPVSDARQVLHVRPRAGPRQSVEFARLRLVPEPAETVTETDFFGNPCDHLALTTPHAELRIEMRARLAVEPPPRETATPSLSALAAEARAHRGLGALDPAHFLGASRMVDDADPALAELRRRLLPGDETEARAAVLALAQGVKAAFRYSPGSTIVGTPLAEVIASRAGVCQDFSHLSIALLRGAGIPAAYVSGFLRTDPPPGKPRLAHADAMHAWISVWLGEAAGWTSFDPTNGVACGTDHILVAIGRDYADVAPVDGVLVTAGPQSTRHTVDVVPVRPDEP